jgi:hypothetical protein
MQGSGSELTGQLAAATRLDVYDAPEQNVPSPLAGEGQGEGGKICERSELNN